MLKKLFGLCFTVTLVCCFSVVTMANTTASSNENYNVIREVLISPLDEEPFIIEFNFETGMILFLEMDGQLAGYRTNKSEYDFWAMVATNIEARGLLSRFMDGEIVRRNSRIYDHKAFTITEYDAFGNQTVFFLSEQEFSNLRAWRNNGIIDLPSGRSNANIVWMGTAFAPPSFQPNIFGTLVGNGFFPMGSWYQRPRFLDLDIISGQTLGNAAHVFFSNRFGTDVSFSHNVIGLAFHNIRYPNDDYGARVTSSQWTTNSTNIQGDTLLIRLSFR
jgi:hypothetical protein